MGKGKKITVGWKYFMGLHVVACHGPIDELQALSFGDRLAWSGSSVVSQDIYVNSPDLFGGDSREGGVQGHVDVCMGDETQGQNAYLVSRLGSTIPAYRGVFGLVFKSFFIGSNNPYLKALSMRIKRIKKGWNENIVWYEAKADIGGAMNPAHVIYQCLTDPEWGMGYPTSSIDDSQFRSAADTLYAEGFGICLLWNQQALIEEFLGDVVDHIGAVVRADQITGKFQLKLLRDDYTVSSLQLFDEDNILDLEEFERPNWGETTNEIVLNYTDMETGTKKTISAQDLANISIQQGNVISAPRDYPGIVSDDIAGRIAVRDLRAVSNTLAKITIVVNRSGFDKTKGDVVKFSWAEKGIVGMPIRIIDIDHGSLTDGKIRIQAVEDIFGLPATSYVQPQGVEWQDESQQPVNVQTQIPIEIPYWELSRTMSAADFAQLDESSAFLSAAALSPSVGQYGFALVTSSGGVYEDGTEQEWCPSCLTTSILDKQSESIQYNSEVDLDSVSVGGYAYIDNEAIEIVNINTTTKTITMKRGVLDTLPSSHISGSRIWFADGFTSISTTERSLGETVSYKLITYAAFGELSESTANAMSKQMVGRFGRPYPPGNVKIEGSYYPTTFESPDGMLDVTWASRNRLQQTASLVDFTEGSITPEPGLWYNLTIKRVSDSTVLISQTGLTATSYSASLPSGDYGILIELESGRGSLVSWQKFSHTMQFKYVGATRITESGDTRITENGNERIVE